MNEIPLKNTGPLVKGALSPDGQEPPRALRALARIIDNDLCHRCGSCIGICPTKVLGLDRQDFPIVKNLAACTDCDLCVKVCPGDEFNVPEISKQLFPQAPDLRDMHGHIEQAYLAYASEEQIRKNSTSGGLISGLLVSLLEQGVITGAAVVASDDQVLWKGKPKIARSKTEILAAMKSKYAISPTNIRFEEIREVEGRYAVVGLPCQIHGYHKAAALDRRIKDRVVLSIGLFCHAAVEHDAMYTIWDSLELETPQQKQANPAQKFISRIGKHPGTPYIFFKDGSTQPVYFPKVKNGYRPSSMEVLNILYRLYTPPRCLTCYDSTSEFADLAVGDPWMTPPEGVDFYDGWSFALARTKRGIALVEQAEKANALVLKRISSELARTSNLMMGHEKRGRAFRIIETRRRQGELIPDYQFEIPRASGKEFILTELNMFSHFFCFVPWGKQRLLRLTLSQFGYWMLWLNSKRRGLRFFRRDLLTKLKRKFGATG